MGYEADRRWSDKYIPAIKQIVGPLLLEEAPFEVDAKQATDLIMLNGRNVAVACRVRRSGYADRYPWEFTLRSRRPNGVKTELAKIVDGWGDMAFYGHAATNGTATLDRWFVICLNRFRANLISRPNQIYYEEKQNIDNSSAFVAFDIRYFTPDILIASSHTVPFEVAA